MNKIKLLFLLCLFFGTFPQAFSHSGKPKYHVIIDTDGAIDDMRAITIFLACNEIRVLGITGSQGTLEAATAAQKCRSLLAAYHHEGIPVGVGKKLTQKLPPWNSFARSIRWGKNTPGKTPSFPAAGDLLNKVTKDYSKNITLIALGSLTTYSDWLKNNPEIRAKIKRIIWYNHFELEQGFNYQVDKESYAFISSLSIPLHIVSNTQEKLLCDTAFLQRLRPYSTVYTKQIANVHRQPAVAEKVRENHLKLWDDLVPLYLTVPIIFKREKTGNIIKATLYSSISMDFIIKTIKDLLVSGTKTNNRVFEIFPTDSALYKPQIAAILRETIEKYGIIEWKATVLTNEIHGHTGIYSIIGVKMGIRACEYFNVGVNNVSALSFAGNEPPLSCLNDGVQISTGATIGQGLIQISDTAVYRIPTVIFESNNQRVQFRLKAEITAQIEQEVAKGVRLYNFSEKYWRYIEELAIEYWHKLSRYDIFEIEKL